jgi:hypothetical protein
LPVPAEQRVRRDDRRDLAQRVTAQPVGSRGKFPPVVIGESEAPPTDLPPQDPILLD